MNQEEPERGSFSTITDVGASAAVSLRMYSHSRLSASSDTIADTATLVETRIVLWIFGKKRKTLSEIRVSMIFNSVQHSSIDDTNIQDIGTILYTD